MTLNEEIPHPVLRAFREEEDVEKEEEMSAHWSKNKELTKNILNNLQNQRPVSHVQWNDVLLKVKEFAVVESIKYLSPQRLIIMIKLHNSNYIAMYNT